MRNQAFETIIGLAVLIVGLGFLYFAVGRTDIAGVEGYTVTAEFARIDGISPGSDVRISGVKVGTINTLTLDPDSYLAVLSLTIRDDVSLPTDTLAKIESEGLLVTSSPIPSHRRACPNCWGRPYSPAINS